VRQDRVKGRQEAVNPGATARVADCAEDMNLLSTGLLLAVAALAVYLLVTLILPERF